MTRFGPCAQYRESIAGFTRTDVWLALGPLAAVHAETFWVGLRYASETYNPSRLDELAVGFAKVAVPLLVGALILRAPATSRDPRARTSLLSSEPNSHPDCCER